MEPSGSEPKITREWAMPSRNTFDVPCIAGFVQKRLLKSKISVDPFARNKRWATWTNDLNPGTQAQYHMKAHDFLLMLKEKGVVADLVIFDPPYSVQQCKTNYQGMGMPFGGDEVRKAWGMWSEEKAAINSITSDDATVLLFGWSSVGMGKAWRLEEMLVVCHGAGHNDTICIAERRIDDGAVAPALLRDNARVSDRL